jgi:hypothetical protein
MGRVGHLWDAQITRDTEGMFVGHIDPNNLERFKPHWLTKTICEYNYILNNCWELCDALLLATHTMQEANNKSLNVLSVLSYCAFSAPSAQHSYPLRQNKQVPLYKSVREVQLHLLAAEHFSLDRWSVKHTVPSCTLCGSRFSTWLLGYPSGKTWQELARQWLQLHYKRKRGWRTITKDLLWPIYTP